MSLSLRTDRPALLALMVIAVICAAATCFAGQARAGNTAPPAVFDVGAASKNINPDTPQYIGGYGYKDGPTKATHDDLEARAFVVGKGNKANVFAVVDSAGWMAAYDFDNAPYGVDATRQKIADALNSRGYSITRANVIISTTHVHAAPTVVGIWGTIDGAYLKKMSDQTVAAAVAAVESKKPSEIWTGVGNLRSFIWQNGQGTNHPDGFQYDNEVPVMWARDPQTGATNGLYASVPNHPDQFNGGNNNELSADWPGYARRALDDLNGGTAVIGPGTLGKQEPPGSDPTYNEVIPQGKIVANEIQRTMAKATPLTNDTIAASEQEFTTLADNEKLLIGINLHLIAQGICLDSEEFCTIPRSKVAPYMAPGPEEDTAFITTHVATTRVGNAVYTTNPGEAFSEVNFAIRDGISGARHVGTLSQSGDMLGYYYERDDYTNQQFGSSNFKTYNVGPDLPADNVTASLAGAQAIGFPTTPQDVEAVYDPTVANRVGVQWYPDELESSDPTISIYGGATRSQDTTIQAPATIDWDFDDGTTETKANGLRFDHTFPGPGTYEVTATATGSNALTRTWTETVKINPALTAAATVKSRDRDGAVVNVTTTGGSGKLIGAVWTCQDGEKVSGPTATCTSLEAGTATAKAADGAGNTATATVNIAAAPPLPVTAKAKLKIVKVKPKSKTVKRGKSASYKVTVGNTGDLEAKGVKVCASVPKKAKKGVKAKPACKALGKVKPTTKPGRPGPTKYTNIRLRTTGKAKAKNKVTIKVSASNARTVKTTVLLKAKAGKK